MKLWSTLAFAALAVAVPMSVDEVLLAIRAGTRQHIGFRIANQAEVEAIYKNDFKAVQSLGTQGRQIGQGTYMSPAFQDIDYEKMPDGIDSKVPNKWDCSVTVDKTVWDGYNKAWIPHYYDFSADDESKQCTPLNLWSMRKDRIASRNRFLGILDSSFDYTSMLLFSYVDQYPGKLQALIPPAIVDEEEFYLTTCAERGTDDNAKIGNLGTVDWGVESMTGFGLGYEKL